MHQRLVPLLLVGLALTARCASAHDYYFTNRKATVASADLDCDKTVNGKRVTYCRYCGGIKEVYKQCELRSACKGFDMEQYDCGYLKTQGGPSVLKTQGNIANYCKAAGTNSGCTGEFLVKFNTDIQGQDLDCGRTENGVKKDFCRITNSAVEVADSCTSTVFGKKCAAFTTNDENTQGFLKVATGPLTTSGDYVTYIRVK